MIITEKVLEVIYWEIPSNITEESRDITELLVNDWNNPEQRFPVSMVSFSAKNGLTGGWTNSYVDQMVMDEMLLAQMA